MSWQNRQEGSNRGGSRAAAKPAGRPSTNVSNAAYVAVKTASLEGYALLKVLGKGAGLEALRMSMSARLARTASADKMPVVSNTTT